MPLEPLGNHVFHVFSGLRLRNQGQTGEGREFFVANVKDVSGPYLSAAGLAVTWSNGVAERHILRTGDLLVVARGAVGGVAMVDNPAVSTIAAPNLIVLRLRDTLKPEVLWAYLSGARGKVALSRLAMSATAQAAVYVQALISMQVPVPSVQEQERIVQMVRAGTECYEKAREAAELQRQLMLAAVAEAVSGRMA